MQLLPIDSHITAIDHDLLGAPGIGVCYVVRGSTIALIEAGTSHTVAQTLAGLEQLGIAREAVTALLCTHIHMDHAGGAGHLATALPNAQVYINGSVIEHLIEPSRLMKSVRRAVGEAIWPLHGECLPIAAERLSPAEELRLDLGNDVVLSAIATPGHSPDHLSFRDHKSSGLFIGDAAGVRMPMLGIELPVTPPPTYNLAEHQATIAKLQQDDFSALYLTHYGKQSAVSERLARAAEQLAQLTELVEAAIASGVPLDDQVLAAKWLGEYSAPAAAMIAQAWGGMSVRGMARALGYRG